MDIAKKSKNNSGTSQRQQGMLLTAVGAVALLSVAPVAAHAEIANGPDMLLTDIAPVSDAELAQNRGGLSIGNLNFDIHVIVNTAINGASATPVALTTTFAINTPGQLTNLGTQISGDVAAQVGNTLADAGVGKDANSGQDSSSSVKVADNSQQGTNTDSKTLLSPPPPPAAGNAKVTDNTTPPTSFTASVDPQTKSINLTNNAGTNVNVTTSNGLITRISNSLSGVGVTTQVDLNYVVNNYHDIVSNAQNLQQAMNLAQQMLAVHGITGH